MSKSFDEMVTKLQAADAAERARREHASLIVYGARCAWFDTIDKASKHASGIPCCPHCGSVLFQIEARHWWAGAQKHEDAGNPGYVALLRWAQGKCFPSYQAAREAHARLEGGAS